MSANNTLFSTTQTSGVAAGLNQNFQNAPRAIYREDDTSVVSVTNQLIQHGWAYVIWQGTNTAVTKAITLPVAFDDTSYDIAITEIGFKSGSNPTSRTDFGGFGYDFVVAQIVNAASFNVSARSGDGATVANNIRSLFYWTAIGTKA